MFSQSLKQTFGVRHSSALKMGAKYSFEIVTAICPATQHHNAEDCSLGSMILFKSQCLLYVNMDVTRRVKVKVKCKFDVCLTVHH
jgi:hypothetical protein